jgi:hypothetical protein
MSQIFKWLGFDYIIISCSFMQNNETASIDVVPKASQQKTSLVVTSMLYFCSQAWFSSQIHYQAREQVCDSYNGINFHKTSGAALGSAKRKRMTRCGDCDGCMAHDCGQCLYCLDKPKFGGTRVLKQCCIQKRCKRVKSNSGILS